MPPSMLAGPTTTRSSGMSAPTAGEGFAVAAQPPADDAAGLDRGRRCRRLDADDQHVAVAEPDEVLGRRAGAADVVDLDRAVLRQRRRVDQHDRHARPPDLLDLGMVVAQADGHDAVDRRPAHRPGQAAVQRRDEVERVAGLLGGDGDAFAERAEERVGEDDRQGLRREHADRQRLALAEHPRDRVGRVAELLGDLRGSARPCPAPAGPGC